MNLYSNSSEGQTRYTNQQLGRMTNLNRIFQMIRKEKGLSRAQLAKETGLTPTTVSLLIDELCDRGLVVERGTGRSVTGRKPILLDVDPDGAMFPVLTMGITGMQYVLLDLGLNVIEEFFLPYPQGVIPGSEETTRQFVKHDVFSEIALRLLTREARKIDWDRVPAVCLSSMGSFQWVNDTFSCTPMRIWTTADFVDDIYRGVGEKPVFIENQTTCLAYAEMQRSCMTGSSFVLINVGEGVGVGRIEYDARSSVYKCSMLEIGHMSIELNGRKCACGNRGCVERYINCKAIVRDIVERIQAGEHSELLSLCDEDVSRIDLNLIRTALENGDELVQDALSTVARCLSAAICNMACIIETEKIVLGGGIEKLGPVFLNYVRESLINVGMRKLTRRIEITYFNTWEDMESIGIVQRYIDAMMPEETPGVLAGAEDVFIRKN